MTLRKIFGLPCHKKDLKTSKFQNSRKMPRKNKSYEEAQKESQKRLEKKGLYYVLHGAEKHNPWGYTLTQDLLGFTSIEVRILERTFDGKQFVRQLTFTKPKDLMQFREIIDSAVKELEKLKNAKKEQNP